MAKEYIEREAALKELEDIGFCDDEPIQTRNSALKIIQNIPAADVRPVVRGKRKNSDFISGMFACNKCGAQRNPNFKVGGGRWNYCPNCGADMREVQDG